MNKKYYVAPSVEVLEMKFQGSLLAGSGEQGETHEEEGDIEAGGLYNFSLDWDKTNGQENDD